MNKTLFAMKQFQLTIQADVPTENGNIYSLAELESAVQELNERMGYQPVFGTFGQPDSIESLSTSSYSHKIIHCSVVDRRLLVGIELLYATDINIESLLQAKLLVISPFSVGMVDPDGRVNNLKFLTFNLTPAENSAFDWEICEQPSIAMVTSRN